MPTAIPHGSAGLGRTLLSCLLLLLLTALLLRFHLVPAKSRLRAVNRELSRIERELGRLRAENLGLRVERDALEDDPVYRERLLRAAFRRTTSEREWVVKERP